MVDDPSLIFIVFIQINKKFLDKLIRVTKKLNI